MCIREYNYASVRACVCACVGMCERACMCIRVSMFVSL